GGNPPADFVGGMSLFVRAPAVGGPFLFKVIVAARDLTGAWTVSDPPAFTSFATLGNAYVRSVNVVEQPAQGMAMESVLLLDGSSTPTILDVGTYDFDGDGKHEVVEHTGNGQVTLWAQSSGTWVPAPFTSPPSLSYLFQFVDLNRDGYAD